jgi:hypothetical protein
VSFAGRSLGHSVEARSGILRPGESLLTEFQIDFG